jgi:hypothetical protein
MRCIYYFLIHIFFVDFFLGRVILEVNDDTTYESLEFPIQDLNLHKIFAVIGTLTTQKKQEYAICVIPGAKNTTTVKLLASSNTVNRNFYANVKKKKRNLGGIS